MTTKRVFVPAALHDELTEYANLVRVLRTTSTLDLTSHLIHHPNSDDDAWSRWPLIDCPVPEWTLSDEIQHLAEFVVPPRDDHGSDSDSDLEGVPSAAANTLVLCTGAVLARILNLMADQRPSAPGSMQNRLRPMNWEDVISLLAVSGLVDPTYVRSSSAHLLDFSHRCASVVARAENRLERVYGPSNTKGKRSHRSFFFFFDRLIVDSHTKTSIGHLCQNAILQIGV